MKNSISHILAFILMVILTVTIFFASGEKELRASIITSKLENGNYYHKIYGTILSKVDDYIVNTEVMQLYKDYLSVDMIKKDINDTITNIYKNKDYKISRYDEFYKIINDYSKDDTISKKYAEGINKIYSNNLFPDNELNIIHKLYVSSTNVLFIIVVALLLSLGLSLLLFIINKNFKFHLISILATGIILILPNIFIKIFGIFDNFIYTNEYYTEILLSIVNGTIANTCLFGLVIIVLLIAYKSIKEGYKIIKVKSK